DPGHRFNDARDMAVAMRTAKWEGGDEPAGWFAIAPAMPRGTNQVGADGRGAGATGVLASAPSADETDVMPVGGRTADATDVMRAGETGRPRRLWLAGIGAGIAALLAATIALAAVGAPAKARTRTPPTTVAVQVPTTAPTPPTTVPVAKAPEPAPHHDPGKAGGDQGDHGG
ncbi:MAG TPA: hypothetical protein VMO88_03855, partial [Acidimicrobiales bacterium]|nr:hypothetical protein [Acidimicrobiales bacterium]